MSKKDIVLIIAQDENFPNQRNFSGLNVDEAIISLCRAALGSGYRVVTTFDDRNSPLVAQIAREYQQERYAEPLAGQMNAEDAEYHTTGSVLFFTYGEQKKLNIEESWLGDFQNAGLIGINDVTHLNDNFLPDPSMVVVLGNDEYVKSTLNALSDWLGNVPQKRKIGFSSLGVPDGFSAFKVSLDDEVELYLAKITDIDIEQDTRDTGIVDREISADDLTDERVIVKELFAFKAHLIINDLDSDNPYRQR